MSRIRSVHPGLATDARFVVLSDAAQIFYVLLLTVADDAGVFRWEPLELRMQLRPASPNPVEPLLDELAAGNFLCRFEAGGHAYGAVRNFRRFQSPNRPTQRHPLPANLFPYVGIESGALHVVPKKGQKKAKQIQQDEDQFQNNSPTAPGALPHHSPPERERERDRDREKDRERESLVERTSSLPRETERDTATRPSPKSVKKVQSEAEPPPRLSEPPKGWLAAAETARDEAGLEPVNLPLEWAKFAARTEGAVERRRWIEWSLRAWVGHQPQRHANGTRGFVAAADAVAETPWAARMRQWHREGWWLPAFGPKPGEPGCFVPAQYLAEAAE